MANRHVINYTARLVKKGVIKINDVDENIREAVMKRIDELSSIDVNTNTDTTK